MPELRAPNPMTPLSASPTATRSIRLVVLAASLAAALAAPVPALATATVRTVAGTGAGGFNGDGIPANTAQVNGPMEVSFDSAGNMYVADYDNHRIRKISATTGLISTVAGTGVGGYNGDGIAATSAQLRNPTGIKVDATGNMYICDQLNHRVRKVTAATGLISTIAGTGAAGFNGDNIPATTAKLYQPCTVTLDASGNIYIMDEWNARVRKVDTGGTITTVAGTGLTTYNGDGISATTANISSVTIGTLDASGDLVFTDRDNHRIRKLAVSTGLISTVAGTGSAAYNGDGLPALSANISNPTGVVYDAAGNLYLTDYGNNRVRRIDAATGLISTVAGSGAAGDSPDGTPALQASIQTPIGVALDPAGTLHWSAYIHRVRRLNLQAISVTKTVTPGMAATGSLVDYTIRVTNTSATVLSSLTIVDTLPAQFAFGSQSSSPALTWNASTTTPAWTGSALSVGPGQTVTVMIHGTAASCTSATAYNTAYAVAFEPGVSDRKSATTAFAVIAPAISIGLAKTQTGGGGVGEPVTYQLVVTNTGTATIDDLVIVDTISPVVTGVTTVEAPGFGPPVVTYVAGTGTRYAWSANGIAFTPGNTLTFTVNGTMGLVCANTNVSNTAFAFAKTACAQFNGFSNAVGSVVRAPVTGLTIVKTQTPPAPVSGGAVSYQIVVTNTGTATVTDLILVDTVSPVVTAVTPTTPGGFNAPLVTQSVSGSIYSWSSSAAFLPGTTAVFQLDGTVGFVCTGTVVSNVAYGTDATDCSVTRTASGVSSFLLSVPTLAITVVKTRTPAAPAIGSAVGYQIVVTNTGSATVDGVTVVDTVSPVVTGIVTTEPGGFGPPVVTSVTAGTRYEWSASAPGLLPPGGTLTFRVDGIAGLVCVATAVDNTAVGAAASACATTRVVSAADSFTINGNTPVLGAVLQATPAAPSSGGSVRYTLVVTNSGAATAATLTVVDTLPEGVAFTGQSASAGLAWNGSRTVPAWTGTVNLAPGQSVTIIVDATTSSTFKGVVTNTGWAFATGGCGATQASATASFNLAPPDELGDKLVKIVGGVRGYLQPKRGEQATILVRPPTAGRITVRIYNLRGELVRELTADATGGRTEVLHWNATDATGADVPPGAYPIVIEAPGVRYKDTLAVLR